VKEAPHAGSGPTTQAELHYLDSSALAEEIDRFRVVLVNRLSLRM